MPLGFGPLSSYPLGTLPIAPEPVTTGGLRRQFRQMCEEMLTTKLSPHDFWLRWRYVQDAVERAIPGPQRKVDKALARYDTLVAEGRSTKRHLHQKLKEDACAGVCGVRALELALQARNKTK
jgi:hypothetical protein